jgi:hypothetical protein
LSIILAKVFYDFEGLEIVSLIKKHTWSKRCYLSEKERPIVGAIFKADPPNKKLLFVKKPNNNNLIL